MTVWMRRFAAAMAAAFGRWKIMDIALLPLSYAKHDYRHRSFWIGPQSVPIWQRI
jgi:hypothetical protein